MKWFKRNLIKIIVIVVHSSLLSKLLLDAYKVKIPDHIELFALVLKLAIPTAMICVGLIGMIRDTKFKYILMALVGGLILWQSYTFDVDQLIDHVRLINDRLASAKPLLMRDFEYLVKTVTILVVTISYLTLYIYPWNIFITDGAFLFFLWSVDNLPNKETILLPLVFLWGFLLVFERMAARDALYSEFKQTKINRRARLVQGLVISALIGAISIGLIRDTRGIYYDKIWIKANDYLMQDDFMSGSYFLDAFSLVRTGYQDTSTSLGGNVAISNELAMRVGGDIPTYLRGNTKYQYTGRLWIKNDMLYRTDNTASRLITDTYQNAPIREMEIIPEGVITSSLFVPAYPNSILAGDSSKDNRVFYGIQDQTFMVNDPLTEAYRVTYYDQATVETLAMDQINESVPQEYQKYLELPNSVTDRTFELVADITSNSSTKAEKLVAITSFLRQNYIYTLTPGRVPTGQDFVDYFLFEDQSGYCVYYATALTVMLRIAGIPARYAEGFKVSAEVDEEGYRLIRNSDAHAWSEVLTDSDSDLWTIWDATGTARDFEDGGSPGSNPDPTTTPGSSSTTPTRTLAEDTLPDRAEGPSPGDGPTGGGFFGETQNTVSILVPVGLVTILGLLLSLKRRRTNQMIREKSGQALLDYVVSLLKDSKMEINDSQTLLEIGKNIVDPDLARHFRDQVQQHYALTYGQTKLRPNEVQRQQLLTDAFRFYGTEHNRMRTWFKKYLF
ncbi:MAG: transglutaminase domain-containing protein [Clostridiaceae bacterium]